MLLTYLNPKHSAVTLSGARGQAPFSTQYVAISSQLSVRTTYSTLDITIAFAMHEDRSLHAIAKYVDSRFSPVSIQSEFVIFVRWCEQARSSGAYS